MNSEFLINVPIVFKTEEEKTAQKISKQLAINAQLLMKAQLDVFQFMIKETDSIKVREYIISRFKVDGIPTDLI